MDKKSLLNLLLVLAVCVAVFGAIKLFQYLGRPKKLSLNIDSGKVTKIDLERPFSGRSDNLFIYKDGDKWKIYITTDRIVSCDENSVKSVLEQIKNVKLEDIVSENKDRWREFQVAPDNGVTVKVYYSDKIKPAKSFILGAETYQSGGRIHLRAVDSPQIWLALGINKFDFEKTFEQWRDKTILKLDRAAIESVEISYPKKTMTVLSRGASWYYTSGDGKETPVDQSKISPFLDTLSNFTADGFMDPAQKTDNKPKFTLKIKTRGSTETVIIGPVKDSRQWVRKQNDDTVYSIDAYKAANLEVIPVETKK